MTAVLLLLHAGAPVVDSPEKPTEVELVMEEHKGEPGRTANPAPTSPAPSAPQAEKPPREEPMPAEARAASPPVQAPVEARPDMPEETTAPPLRSDAAPESDPSPAREPDQAPAAATDPTPAAAPAPVQQARTEPLPPTQPAPRVSLSGTDSPSDARAWGDRILPAAPDAVFHNRPPEYPQQAALNGQHGTVVVLIHVSPAGTAAGVDLVRSSGYVLLDRAARDAVLRWRFLPAVKDGRPVASDMEMGFIFDNQ